MLRCSPPNLPPTHIRHHSLASITVVSPRSTLRGRKDREEGTFGERWQDNSMREVSTSIAVGGSRPDAASGTHQALTGPAEPKWARKVPAAALQQARRRHRYLSHQTLLRCPPEEPLQRLRRPAQAQMGPKEPRSGPEGRCRPHSDGQPAASDSHGPQLPRSCSTASKNTRTPPDQLLVEGAPLQDAMRCTASPARG